MDSIPFNNAVFLSGVGKILNNDFTLLDSKYLSCSIFSKK
jgi:hypothetical protein